MPSLLHAQSELLWGQGRDPWFEWVVAGVQGLPSSAAGGARAGGGPAGAGGKFFRRSSRKRSCVAGLFGSCQKMLPSLIHLSPNSYREPAMSQAGCWGLRSRFFPGGAKETGDGLMLSSMQTSY